MSLWYNEAFDPVIICKLGRNCTNQHSSQAVIKFLLWYNSVCFCVQFAVQFSPYGQLPLTHLHWIMWRWCRHRGRGFRAPWVKIWNLMMIWIHRECSSIQLCLKVQPCWQVPRHITPLGYGCPEFESRIPLSYLNKGKILKKGYRQSNSSTCLTVSCRHLLFC